MADDIKQIIEETSERTAEKVRKEFKESTEEVKRHMDVVAEDLKGQIQQIAEGVAMNTERLERIEKQTEKIEPMQDDIEAIKVTLDIIKNDLKEKVGRDEFVALERRVGMLETKFRPI